MQQQWWEQAEKRKSQKIEDQGARKGRKVTNHCVFPMFCGSRGSKSRLAKAAGAETSGQMRDQKLHSAVARSTYRSERVEKKLCGFGACLVFAMFKEHKPSWREAYAFGSWGVQTLHAVVARSTFRSQTVKSTPRSDHFWTLSCPKTDR